MSTPPFEITGNKETLKPVSEKPQLPEKFIKIEKIEKLEYKEKPEKIEHKEKPEKYEHKEKPEKYEHKEKPEKFEHKEKIEIIEKLVIRDTVNKPDVLEHPGKDLVAEIPITDPGGPVEDLAGRLGRLEQTVGQLQHFITTNLRPDLSKGALKQEPDAGSRKS